MIFLDAQGLPVDRTLDGGDSCVRAGLLSLIGNHIGEGLWLSYTTIKDKKMLGLRHPVQEPWNNPNNFSRDQLVRLVAGLKATRSYQAGPFFALKLLYNAAMGRAFFAQNKERDAVGTTKYPWPHKVDGKWRLFDMPDPLTPDVVYMMAKAAEHPTRHLFAIPGILFFLLSLLIERAFNIKNEQDRTICICSVFGAWAFKAYVKIIGIDKICKDLYNYWDKDRNEKEYADGLMEYLMKQIKPL